MKINHKILSIPPHISTAWKNIASLGRGDDGSLIVTLVSGSVISIPSLEEETIQKIFHMHEEVLEKGDSSKPSNMEFSFGMPFKADEGMGGFANMMMQHDPSQADSPDLPPDILSKITSVSKAIGIEELAGQMPPPEPHCNCPYCQMMRAMNNEPAKPTEDEVSDDELTFRDWTVESIGDKLYRVTSPFDPSEQYQVFLGDPIGCTCGTSSCEHIKIVLSS